MNLGPFEIVHILSVGMRILTLVTTIGHPSRVEAVLCGRVAAPQEKRRRVAVHRYLTYHDAVMLRQFVLSDQHVQGEVPLDCALLAFHGCGVHGDR